jgi:hypothetical protein
MFTAGAEGGEAKQRRGNVASTQDLGFLLISICVRPQAVLTKIYFPIIYCHFFADALQCASFPSQIKLNFTVERAVIMMN